MLDVMFVLVRAPAARAWGWRAAVSVMSAVKAFRRRVALVQTLAISRIVLHSINTER